MKDIACWAERHFVAASVRCKEPIERKARYSAEWTDRWYEQEMSRYSKIPPAPGAISPPADIPVSGGSGRSGLGIKKVRS
jgi:hypothetical protein